MSESLLSLARANFHKTLVDSGTLVITRDGDNFVASNADKSQRSSRDISLHIARQLNAIEGPKRAGQSSGTNFESAVTDFLSETFLRLDTVRPGRWFVENLGNQRRVDVISEMEPYRHLADLARALTVQPDLAAALGNSYVISPDIIVLRESVEDETLNDSRNIVDCKSAMLSPLRRANSPDGEPVRFLHAVISCKWTMRSDRSQNTRAEALNLLRNRKGRAPHIVAITAEPGVSRIASLALGTGDIDMVYHAALPELREAVRAVGSDDAKEMLRMLIEGQRLRDISDLPLDLAV